MWESHFNRSSFGVVVVLLSMRQKVGGSIPHTDTSYSKLTYYIIYNVSYLVMLMLTYKWRDAISIDLKTLPHEISSAALG